MKRDDLKLLGVQERFIGSEPTVYSFPPVFNPDGILTWTEVLELPEFETALDQWRFAISEYTRRMQDKNKNPLRKTGPTRIDNAWITEYLRLQRKRVVQYYNRLGVLKDSDCWRLKTEHEVEPVQSGFWIHSRMYLKQADQRGIIKRLREFHFYPDRAKEKRSDLGYVHWFRWHVGQFGRVKFGFAAKGRLGGIFSFSIYVPRLPLVMLTERDLRGKANTTPFEEFIRRFIWLPLVFQFRFKELDWMCGF